jgi:hypothetical protein
LGSTVTKRATQNSLLPARRCGKTLGRAVRWACHCLTAARMRLVHMGPFCGSRQAVLWRGEAADARALLAERRPRCMAKMVVRGVRQAVARLIPILRPKILRHGLHAGRVASAIWLRNGRGRALWSCAHCNRGGYVRRAPAFSFVLASRPGRPWRRRERRPSTAGRHRRRVVGARGGWAARLRESAGRGRR